MKHITIKGRLTKDAEIKTFGNDDKVLNFSVAVDDGYKEDKSTYFFECLFFRTGLSTHLTKGTEVIVIGNLKTRMYNDKTYLQVKASIVDVIWASKKTHTSDNRYAEGDNLSDNNNDQQTTNDLDDEIPF